MRKMQGWVNRLVRNSALSIMIGATFAIQGAKPTHAGVMMEGFCLDCPSGGSYQDWWDHLAGQANTFALDGFSAIWIPCALKGASGGYSSDVQQPEQLQAEMKH